MPTALITGVTGQDGSYLAEFLLEQGYTVIGMVRRTSTINFDRIRHFQDRIEIVQGDLLDQMSVIGLLQEYRPQEVYNLAAQSFVPTSFTQPVLTGEFTALGVTRMLEAVRIVDPKIRFYQASSSEMFGKVMETPQRETTPFYPRSPYGVAKVYGHWITINYRESYNIFGCSGILFNHESPRRGETSQAYRCCRHFRATYQHGIGITHGNQLGTQADIVGTGSTGSHHRQVRTLKVEHHRQVARYHIDNGTRDEKWRNFARTRGLDDLCILLYLAYTTDARSDGTTYARCHFLTDHQPGVPHGLDTCRHSELDKKVHLARILDRQILLNVEVLHAGAEARAVGGDIKTVDRGNAAPARKNTLPGFVHRIAKWTEHAHARYNNSSANQHVDSLLS